MRQRVSWLPVDRENAVWTIDTSLDGFVLLKRWRQTEKRPYRVGPVAQFHSDFELIHPFGDGNGRVGRLLMLIQLLRRDYPPVIVENTRKAEYYEVLEYAQRKSVEPFTVFLVDEMERTHAVLRRYLR